MPITTTITFDKWPVSVAGPITTQAQLDECAEDLWVNHHIPSTMSRGWDEHEIDFRKLLIHSPLDGGPMTTAEIGSIVILFNGQPEALTPHEFTARGFTEEPAE